MTIIVLDSPEGKMLTDRVHLVNIYRTHILRIEFQQQHSTSANKLLLSILSMPLLISFQSIRNVSIQYFNAMYTAQDLPFPATCLGISLCGHSAPPPAGTTIPPRLLPHFGASKQSRKSRRQQQHHHQHDTINNQQPSSRRAGGLDIHLHRHFCRSPLLSMWSGICLS